MSRKQEQLASAIERGVQTVIARGLADPRVRGLITVTGVRVSPDGEHATISVSVLPEERETLTLHGLRDGAVYIRREVGDLIQTRRMPQFDFRLDKSLKKQAATLRAIAEAREETEETEAEDADDATRGDQ